MIRKSKKVYVRWSFIYMIVPALILVTVFFCGIRFLQHDMKLELVQSHKATAELIDSKIEKFLINTDAAAKSIIRNKQLKTLMRNKEHDMAYYGELYNLNLQISNSFGGDYISDCAIYIKDGEELIHAASVFPAESFYMDYCPYEINDYESWTEILKSEHVSDLYRDKNGDILYMASVYENTSSNSKILGTVVFKIPDIALRREFAEGVLENSANVFVKQQGRMVYSLYDWNSSDVTFMDDSVITENGIMYFGSKVGVLNVYYAVNESNAFRRLLTYENAVVIIAVILLITGAVLTVLLSKWQYRPIESLVKKIGGSGKDYTNEFEYINASIDYYEKQQNASIEKLARYRETALSQMLARHILKKGCENLQAVFQKCDYSVDKYNSIVIIFVESVNEELWSGNNQDYQLMHFAIENVCSELFREEFSLLTIPVNDAYYTGLVSSENEEGFSEKIKEIYSKVEEVLGELGVGLTIKVGEKFADIENLRQEYNKIEPHAKKPKDKHSADLVKIWEEASDTSDIKNAEKRISEIMVYINEHYGDCSLTMESIAHHIGLNSRYMLKIFKEQTGVLLKDYVLKIRIDKAKELLATDMTIEAVARSCGYTSSHSFIRAFKRACGMTPGEMRQASENDEDANA